MTAPPRALARRLLAWYRLHRRELPWRGVGDPYRVWVSEVMLQQTRVEAVVAYYERFLTRFPDVAALAAAPREEVLAHWAGLGYYRRARMLHEAARQVMDAHGGVWPSGHDAMLALPGIGDYTAAAIASIAFDEARAALDGNAYRVLARLADERRELRAVAPKRSLQALGQSLIESTRPGERGDFTQALMELGATLCVPRSPACAACPWLDSCAALAAGTAPDLPTKSARRAPRRVELSVAIARLDGRVLLRQRPSDASVMPGFWELPSAEGPCAALTGLGPLVAVHPVRERGFSHAITDTRYACTVHAAVASREPGPGYRWVSPEELRDLPLATISRKALRGAND